MVPLEDPVTTGSSLEIRCRSPHTDSVNLLWRWIVNGVVKDQAEEIDVLPPGSNYSLCNVYSLI